MKILIVDDEANIANGIQNILKFQLQIPCKIEVATTVEEAVQIGAAGIDLLISDIVMPGMSGLDLIRLFREKGYCLYAIILSGHDKFAYAQTALRYGVVDYLLKPVDGEALVRQCMKVNSLLLETYSKASAAPPPDFPFFSLDLHQPDQPASLRKMIAWLQQNYMKEITLQGIAEEMMLNPSYLSSLINKHCGHSFNYLLDYIRISMAVKLMQSEKKISISEISYLVGYANERRLYHACNKRLGCTPGQLKARLGNGTVRQ